MGKTKNAEAMTSWIEREKIRCAWCYEENGTKVQQMKDCGINTIIVSENNPSLENWARDCAAFEMHLFVQVYYSRDINLDGVRRCVFATGLESPVACPADRVYWEKVITAHIVELVSIGLKADQDISGILCDFELYHNYSHSGQAYYTEACYCDDCINAFFEEYGIEVSPVDISLAQRVAWLKEKDLFDVYHPFQQKRVRACAEKMRDTVHTLNPDFFLGFYPSPFNWMLEGVAQGMSSPKKPIILWTTDTYEQGGAEKIPVDWQESLAKKEIYAYNCCGFLFRCYSSLNLAANLYQCVQASSGYWLFVMRCVWKPKVQRGWYYLAQGGPAEYLNAIKTANTDIDKIMRERDYETSLKLVPDPVFYHQVNYSADRFEVPKTAVIGSIKPTTKINPARFCSDDRQMLVLDLKKEQTANLRFELPIISNVEVWGISWNVVSPENKVIASGQMPPGIVSQIDFVAPVDGIYTIILQLSYVSCFTITETNVPFAVWLPQADDELGITDFAKGIYFYVPEGIDSFKIGMRCGPYNRTGRLIVCKPDGSIAVDTRTDPQTRCLSADIPTDGNSGELWSLAVCDVDGTGFNTICGDQKPYSVSLQIDKRIPPFFTLTPDYRFAPR